jgi:hypothetical protein
MGSRGAEGSNCGVHAGAQPRHALEQIVGPTRVPELQQLGKGAEIEATADVTCTRM